MAIRLAFIVEAKDNVDIVVKYDEVLNILTIEQGDAWITVPADVVEDLRQALSEQASDLEEHRYEGTDMADTIVSFNPAMQCGAVPGIGGFWKLSNGDEIAIGREWTEVKCMRVRDHRGPHKDENEEPWIDKENAE